MAQGLRPSVEMYSAQGLRNRGDTLAGALDPYPSEIPMDNVVQPVANRPEIGDLYDKLNVLNRKPLDYAGISKVNAARTEQGDREFLGGLALQALGGKTLAPAGKHVFEQALAKQTPIRPNAADVGWTDPETGEFHENPLTKRASEERLLTGRIDALVKEEESKARIAIAKGDKERAAIHQNNVEQLLAQGNAIRQQHANTAGTQVTVNFDKAAMRGQGGTKPLQHSEQKDIAAVADAYRNLNQVHSTFKDEYAGGITGTPGQELTNAAMSNFPELTKMTMGAVGKGKSFKAEQEKAQWWGQQKRLDEMVERHTMFGSALTASEVASWKAASIQPGMDAKQIRDNMVIREGIIRQKAEQMRNMHLENGKIPGAVNAAFKNIPMNAYQTEDGEAAPAPARTPAAAPRAAVPVSNPDADLLAKYPPPPRTR